VIKVTLWEFITDRWPRLSAEAFQHASVVLQCTVIAAIIGVVAGIAVYRSPVGSTIATALASTILTIPSFALLGLLIPLVGLGVAPTVIALVLYALLPIVRNTIVGLGGVDAAVTDAARGIGMNRMRVLTLVELRLAWPAILAGMPPVNWCRGWPRDRVGVQVRTGRRVFAGFAWSLMFFAVDALPCWGVALRGVLAGRAGAPGWAGH
jgi:ABC-type proline/glycine betaine transport system permease subunit